MRMKDLQESFGRLGAGRLINARRSLSELDEVFAMLERGAMLKCAVIP